MMPGLRARRRADDFNALVESHSAAGLEARAEEFDADLALVGLMRSTTPEQPRPDFVTSLRAELMAEAAEVLSPAAARLTVPPRTAARERRMAVAIGGFAVVSAATSMAAVAQDSLPGDALYPLKRAIENAGTTLQFNEHDRAESMLDQAAGRLTEAQALMARGDADGAFVADTLHDFTDQARVAAEVIIDDFKLSGDDKSLHSLSGFATTSKIALDQLQSGAPPAARPSLIEATQVIEQISREISYLCPECEAAIAPQAAVTPVETHLVASPMRVSSATKQRQRRAETTDDDASSESGSGDDSDPGTNLPAPQPVEEQPRKTELRKTADDTTVELTDTVDRLVESVTGSEGEGGLLGDTLDTLGKTAGNLLGGGR